MGKSKLNRGKRKAAGKSNSISKFVRTSTKDKNWEKIAANYFKTSNKKKKETQNE